QEGAIPQMPADLERRWPWFVALAVQRFDVWCHALKLRDAQKSWEEILPPIDVLMVWHAYMLNPIRWYTEDCMRIPACKILKVIGTHFATALNDQLRYIISTSPSPARSQFWHNKTALPFDPVQSSHKLATYTIRCPQCRAHIVIKMMTPEGSGYLQQKFSTFCPQNCGIKEITKETLGLRKMAIDLTSGTLFNSSPPSAAVIVNPSFPSAVAIGSGIKAQICKRAKVSTPGQYGQINENAVVDIIKFAEYSLSTLKGKILTSQVGPPRRLTSRILSAYVDDKAYSVELAGAVLRQSSFVNKMNDLGWTGPGFFDYAGDELALQHAISRYHAFLDLMASSPATFFVPTLDIDLVWHTHQLISDKYKSDCTTYVGRFIDHDDKVEGLQLSSAFNITCEAWKARFHVQYSHCGCPIPGDSIGSKLVRLIASAENLVPPSHLLPFNRPDLLSATHPSDHNAVHFQSTNKRAHKLAMRKYESLARKREHDIQKAAEKAAKQAAKNNSGKVDRKQPAYLSTLHSPHLQTSPHPQNSPHLRTSRDQNSGTNARSAYGYGYGYGYGYPFLVPVPIFYGGGVGLGGCVAAGGSVIDPSGSCGIGGFNAGGGCGGTAGGGAVCGGSGSGCGGGAGGGGCGGAGGCGGGGCGGGCGGGG
ncbi:hypothetical protein BYT27DRAFT_7107670, partial [Phlegmacium glaucopus]